MSRRPLVVVNVLFRAFYGVGALATPKAMAGARLVPDTDDRPADRLFVRGFGAHQIGVAAVGLAALRERRLMRPAMALAIAIDSLDMASAALEARARGRADFDVAGGFVLSTAGVLTAAAALRA